MPFKLLHGSEVFLARRTPSLHDLVFHAHERIQIMALYFFSDRAQKLRLFHDHSPTGAAEPRGNLT
jgi:hypothetical protein